MLDLQDRLSQQRQQGLYRQRHAIDHRQGNTIIVDGKRLVNFASNDYLGLANDPRLINALKDGADRYGVGSGASQLISGYSRAHQELEERIAAFLNRPRTLLFATGYMANLGVITSLLSRHSHLLLDRRSHASLVDAALLSRTKISRYHTADIAAAIEKLSVKTPSRLLASDSVFSMDGDIAPLARLVTLSKENSLPLLIDDAHGFGVLGETGRGCLEQDAIGDNDIEVYVGTLGKACGTSGAFVSGSDALIETLIQKARSVIYTTAPPPAIAHATLTSLDIIEQESWRRKQITTLVKRFRQGAMQIGLSLTKSETAIQAVIVGENKAAVAASAHLKSKGYYASAIRPPTVAAGTARLRITLCAHHSEADVDRLLAAFDSWRTIQS